MLASTAAKAMGESVAARQDHVLTHMFTRASCEWCVAAAVRMFRTEWRKQNGLTDRLFIPLYTKQRARRFAACLRTGLSERYWLVNREGLTVAVLKLRRKRQ